MKDVGFILCLSLVLSAVVVATTSCETRGAQSVEVEEMPADSAGVVHFAIDHNTGCYVVDAGPVGAPEAEEGLAVTTFSYRVNHYESQLLVTRALDYVREEWGEVLRVEVAAVDEDGQVKTFFVYYRLARDF